MQGVRQTSYVPQCKKQNEYAILGPIYFRACTHSHAHWITSFKRPGSHLHISHVGCEHRFRSTILNQSLPQAKIKISSSQCTCILFAKEWVRPESMTGHGGGRHAASTKDRRALTLSLRGNGHSGISWPQAYVRTSQSDVREQHCVSRPTHTLCVGLTYGLAPK